MSALVNIPPADSEAGPHLGNPKISLLRKGPDYNRMSSNGYSLTASIHEMLIQCYLIQSDLCRRHRSIYGDIYAVSFSIESKTPISISRIAALLRIAVESECLISVMVSSIAYFDKQC